MKKYLLPKNGKFYKANMHCHTVISDGKMTPEEVKEYYKSHGYSIVAFTDHEIMIPHADLTDEEFLPITAYEIQVKDCNTQSRNLKLYHMNLYSPDPNRYLSKTLCKKDAWWGNIVNHFTDEMAEAGVPERYYDKKFVQWIIDTANAEGCLISYNHPVWSLQTKEDYTGLKGFWGVEWYNTGCVKAGYFDTFQPITDLLSEGERVFPLATDDNHSTFGALGGWIQVKARSLNYDTVFAALRRGDFYSSTGPAIKSLYIEDGKVTIKTSAAKRISFITDRRLTTAINAKDGKLLTSAEFSLESLIENHEITKVFKPFYFRITVEDKYGNMAATRAYFSDELGY